MVFQAARLAEVRSVCYVDERPGAVWRAHAVDIDDEEAKFRERLILPEVASARIATREDFRRMDDLRPRIDTVQYRIALSGIVVRRAEDDAVEIGDPVPRLDGEPLRWQPAHRCQRADVRRFEAQD